MSFDAGLKGRYCDLLLLLESFDVSASLDFCLILWESLLTFIRRKKIVLTSDENNVMRKFHDNFEW